MAERGGDAVDATAATVLDPTSKDASGQGPEEAGGFFSGSDCDELEVDLEAELAGLLPDGLEQERAGLEADVGQGRPEAPREAQEERGLPEVDLEAELGDLLPDGLEEEPVASGGTELDGLFSEAEEANNQPEGREDQGQEPRPAPDPGSADLDGLFSDAEEPAPPAAAAPRQQEIAAAAPDADALPAEPGAAAEAGDQTSGPVTPPPPPPPPPEVPAGFATAQDRAAADVDFADESRYMEGPDGEKLLKWKVDYANRGGSGRAMCRDLDCLERHDQAGVRTIEKGALRIGRRVLMEKDSGTPQINIFWHHARCMFNTFLRSRKQTRVIQSEGDIEGFEALMPEDQDLLRRYISGNEDIRGARRSAGRPGGGGGPAAGAGRPLDTPEKRGAGRAFDDGPAAKRQRPLLEVKGRVGDRVWTFCRVRPPAPPGGAPPALGGGPVKSAKAELGIVVAEEVGSVVVQFESEEHEKERMEGYNNPRLRRTRAWRRYPRIFEGKKQRVPHNWVQWNRPPPRLCSCTKQEWGHQCECGISCGRGTTSKVYGVCQ